jgi:hypothetical protein
MTKAAIMIILTVMIMITLIFTIKAEELLVSSLNKRFKEQGGRSLLVTLTAS